jgi:nucleoside-diphosphate-sugar epimerase
MKAIVTGATGGLGRNLVEFLLEKKWEVIAFGRNKEIGKKLNTKFVSFDISNEQETINNFEKVDVVFHCAALSSPWGKYMDFFLTNVKGTRNILKAMKITNTKKIIYVSSPSIYFNFEEQLNIKEDYLPKKFINDYAKTKHISEQYILKENDSKIHSVIIRPRAIFGEYDTVLMPRLEKIARKGYLPIIKKYKNKDVNIDVTYVGNVVYSLYLAATVENIPNKSIFNITNDETTEIIELLSKILKSVNLKPKKLYLNFNFMVFLSNTIELFFKIFKLKKEPIITKYGIGVISLSQTLDIDNAKKILGYKPIYSIREGIDRYSKWRLEEN